MISSRFRLLVAALAATLSAGAAQAQNTTPVLFSFSTVGDSRQDPVTFDQASVGATLSGQDSIWLQNTKAFARILRTIQAQKSTLLFFNGDMINGYGWNALGYTSNFTTNTMSGPTAPASTSDVVNSDLLKAYQQYAFWRGLVAPVMETGTYVFPVPGNHETVCKFCPANSDKQKVAKVENEQAYAANMGDLILDNNRFNALLGTLPQSFNPGPTAGNSPDGLTTDQSKLSYSFDYKGFHFVVINTDPVGGETSAPTNWLSADLAAAKARGAKKIFVFGHKPAYNYNYQKTGVASSSSLDATAATTVKRDAFWNVIEQYGATYFSGHEHVYNISQPKGGAYQVIVGSGGSPFDDKSTVPGANPLTDRSYAWATVRVHQDGGVDILGYGFDEHFGPTQLYQQIYLP